jgi:hypothetical protein
MTAPLLQSFVLRARISTSQIDARRQIGGDAIGSLAKRTSLTPTRAGRRYEHGRGLARYLRQFGRLERLCTLLVDTLTL